MAPEQLELPGTQTKKRLIAEGAHIAVPAEAGRRGDWRPLVAPSYSWKLMAPSVQLEDLAHLRQLIQTKPKEGSARVVGWQGRLSKIFALVTRTHAVAGARAEL